MARAWRLQIIMLLALGAFVVAAVAINWAAGASAWQRVAAVDDIPRIEPLYDEDLKVFIVRTPEGLRALSARGPWRDEKVVYCLTAKWFEAPFSGSKFDRYGNYYGGPAPRGMTRFPLRIEDGIVYVQMQAPIEGPERGEVKPLEPGGPMCLGG